MMVCVRSACKETKWCEGDPIDEECHYGDSSVFDEVSVFLDIMKFINEFVK